MSGNPLAKLRDLAKDLPTDLVADWDGTNHFELQYFSQEGDYWWLELVGDAFNCQTEYGRRVGLLLDIVAEVSRLKAEGVL